MYEKRGCDEGEESEKKDPMVVVAYVADLSGDITRVWLQDSFPVEHDSAEPAHARVKEKLPDSTKSCVVCHIHCMQLMLWEGLHK